MIGWLIIGILIVLAIFILKMNHMKHRMWVFFIVLLALFLYISINIVYNKYDLNFNSTEGVADAAKIYFGWLGNGFQNMKTLVGNAVKMDWTSSDKSTVTTINTSVKNKSNTNVNTAKK